MISKFGENEVFCASFLGEGPVALILRCLCWGEIAPPLPGGLAQFKWLWIHYVVCFSPWKLLAPRGRWKWWHPSLWPWSWKFLSPILQWTLTEKQFITVISLVSLELCVQPNNNPVFLSQTCDPVSNLQSYRFPWHGPMPFLTGEGHGSHHASAFWWAPPREGPCHSAAVHSLWQYWAESLHLDSLFSANFPSPVSGNLVALKHQHSFCDPEDPETAVPPDILPPSMPPEHL